MDYGKVSDLVCEWKRNMDVNELQESGPSGKEAYKNDRRMIKAVYENKGTFTIGTKGQSKLFLDGFIDYVNDHNERVEEKAKLKKEMGYLRKQFQYMKSILDKQSAVIETMSDDEEEGEIYTTQKNHLTKNMKQVEFKKVINFNNLLEQRQEDKENYKKELEELKERYKAGDEKGDKFKEKSKVIEEDGLITRYDKLSKRVPL